MKWLSILLVTVSTAVAAERPNVILINSDEYGEQFVASTKKTPGKLTLCRKTVEVQAPGQDSRGDEE